MRISKQRMSRVVAVAAIPFFTGCATLNPSPVQKAAKAMVGKPVSVAFKAFGRPLVNQPPEPSASPGAVSYNGNYFWDSSRVHVSPNLTFVQTGSRYVGSHVAAVNPAGNGVAEIPLYQDDYEATGYYGHETVLDYVCMITIKTNHADIITKVQVGGCQK